MAAPAPVAPAAAVAQDRHRLVWGITRPCCSYCGALPGSPALSVACLCVSFSVILDNVMIFFLNDFFLDGCVNM